MLHYIILGIIEGLTEFLPISSTAHLILYNYFTNFDITSDFIKAFQIIIQMGAILAVIFYYFKELIKLETIKLLIISVIPTLVLGFVFKKYVSILQEMPLLIAINLILGGVIIIIAEQIYISRNISHDSHEYKGETKKITSVSTKEGLIMGLVQSIAMIPGVSRSGAVIVYGLFRNYEREVVAKFTFLLVVPTMLAATLYSVYKNRDLIMNSTNGDNFNYLLTGFIAAFIVAMLIVKYALPFIRKYSFTPFGIYRIVVGVSIILYLF